ncbi:F-box/FBD/LRR-repeat protein At5g53840-like [Nicotiana tabacum]|uniref:F-box/FBD/LRR-repeat protein At5g53840-like n=2 Tax=Nicotiana TaxID=4085 RepID=A0A1S3XDP3_TOBAC|nr:PREDICTED: F-box/FBD/LRR-repeat protein At5g53840-like isoform X1 [Nicotiana sylvestris]XP_016437893.1 PREDICTED: F-box/FBD/LRR-repeat protein At5g53840-like [Nicotiana tabacum]
MDRIGGLPDGILIAILSFLDTKTAVRTSVLSKRWKLVWTSLPVLDFENVPYSRWKSRIEFIFFVRHVLARRCNSQLVKLRLSVDDIVYSSFSEECMTYAADHRVKNLIISAFTTENPVFIPTCLLSSQFLEFLELNCAIRYTITLPKSWTFTNLKVLKLKNFVFSDDNFDDGKIFSGCPKLESVILCKCAIKGRGELKELEMKCLELKKLEILYWRSPLSCYDIHRINVIAPKLSSFVFKGHVAKVCFKEDLGCLDRVCIDLRYPKWNSAEDRKRWTGECFMTMFGQFCSARFLSLSIDTVEALSAISGIREYVTFGNLRHIKFVTEDRSSSVTMPINAVADILKCTADGYLVFNASEDNKLSTLGESSHSDGRKAKKDSNIIDVPIHLMSYLLEIAPRAESLTVEFAKESFECVEVRSDGEE